MERRQARTAALKSVKRISFFASWFPCQLQHKLHGNQPQRRSVHGQALGRQSPSNQFTAHKTHDTTEYSRCICVFCTHRLEAFALRPIFLPPRKPHKRTQERLWTCLGREHAPAGRYLRRGRKEGPVADEQGGNARYHPDELACKRSSASSLRQGHQSNDFAD